MTSFSKFTLACAASVMAIGSVALAQPTADLNEDGQVTQAEFLTVAGERFAETDLNKDGYLSDAERQAGREKMRADYQDKRFDDMDADSDGVVTRTEFTDFEAQKREKWAERRMERRDVNDDGVVDEADREAMKDRWAERKAKWAERKGDRKGFFERKGKGRHGGGHWNRIDSNSDGMIDEAEYLAGAEMMFARMDANEDGVLVEGEGRRHHKGRRGFRR